MYLIAKLNYSFDLLLLRKPCKREIRNSLMKKYLVLKKAIQMNIPLIVRRREDSY